MSEGNDKKHPNDSGLNFEAQLWTAAEQAVPAPDFEKEYNGDPYKGRVFDPCRGSGGMFVQSEKFVEEHGGRVATSRFTGRNGRKSIQRLAMKESRTLAALRDALLPKLLSGELRVPAC